MPASAPRLFIAVWPPAAIIEQLRSLSGGAQPPGRWVNAENWHVTLRFLGNAEPAALVDRLDRATLPAATARLGPTVRRLGRNMVVVPVAGLDELAATVRAATADVGQPLDRRPFTGHVTLARLRHGERNPAVGAPFSAEFRTDEVTLVHSTLGARGAVYDVIGRWATR